MNRVIIFNITGMELYNGLENGDDVFLGGEYVKRNRTGGEIYNFQDYNGYCYGYVSTKSGTIRIDRIDNISKDSDKIENVLVIWTAKLSINQTNVIVGWYKNAEVYKNEHSQYQFPGVGRSLFYNCKAKSEDCFLLPMSERKFIIERAKDKGTGMGLGQSNVWFADSDYGRKIFLPQLLEYIDSYSGERINNVLDQDAINVVLSDKDADIEGVPADEKAKELSEKGSDLMEAGDYYRALAFYNSSLKHDTMNFGANIPISIKSDTFYNIGNALRALNCFDESIKYFEKVVDLEGETEEVLGILLYLYVITEMDQKALGIAKKLLGMVDSTDSIKMSSIYRVISLMNFRLSNFEEATDALDEVIKRTTDKDEKEELLTLKYLNQKE